MKLTLEEKIKLIKLSKKASNLLVTIIDEDLPAEQKATNYDIKFKNTLTQIEQTCPLLSDSYMTMYNYIQKQKISQKDTYFKKFTKNKN